jgi:hypothetical protein
LNSGSNQLPWTEVILLTTSTSGQRVVIIGPGGVYSRAVNGRSGRGVRKRVIAVTRVNKRRGAGGAARRASGIERPSMAKNAGGNRASGIAIGGANGKSCQLTRMRRARASAQRLGAKILRRGPAIGRVATSISRFPINIRAGVFAVWRAAWRYVACWIVKRGIGRGVGACVVSA